MVVHVLSCYAVLPNPPPELPVSVHAPLVKCQLLSERAGESSELAVLASRSRQGKARYLPVHSQTQRIALVKKKNTTYS